MASYDDGPATGLLHRYSGRKEGYESTGLVAFEYTHQDGSKSCENIVLFVSGLNEGIATLGYPRFLSTRLPDKWSLAEVLLRSSYKGFGFTSLQTDIEDIGECVAYFRRKGKKKIVILGHSTGCQDCIAYAVFPGYDGIRPAVDGLILQGPVSDREAMDSSFPAKDLQQANKIAKDLMQQRRPNELLPVQYSKYMLDAPTTAYRWLSMTSPDHHGNEDFFSSDLLDSQLDSTFGAITKLKIPLAAILSGSDESTPSFVDKGKLLERWKDATKRNGGKLDPASGIITGASHNYEGNDEKIVNTLADRVVDFIRRL